jgi:heme-degrading monooxygenase HmoA
MYTSTFTFAQRAFDESFHALDQAIAQAARATPGYVGEESWDSSATGLICNVYYWDSLEALQQLMEHPVHVAAKQRQAEWLGGYQVTIAQVLRSYGDRGIAHPLAAWGNPAPKLDGPGSDDRAFGLRRRSGLGSE